MKMKRRIIAGAGAVTLILSIGVSQSFAAVETPSALNSPSVMGRQRFDEMGGSRKELTDEQKAEMGNIRRPFEEATDEQKAEMEAMRAQREEKLNTFIQTLSDEQKALYEAAMPTKMTKDEGLRSQKPDEAALTAMKEKQESFIASLTDAQKTAYEELFENMRRSLGELTDEQKAEMETIRAQREEKLNAFTQTLSEEQKALFEAAMPAQTPPEEGQRAEKPDEAAMTAMKEKQEAFVASLTAAQKEVYDELFENARRPFGVWAGEQKADMEGMRSAKNQ